MADRRADELLQAAYCDGGGDVFPSEEPDQLEADKNAAASLVQLRLAYYTDEARDRIQITNSGRYWALNGGYMAFLKEDPPTGWRRHARSQPGSGSAARQLHEAQVEHFLAELRNVDRRIPDLVDLARHCLFVRRSILRGFR